MAFYKQPCVHCGSLTDRDARVCPSCGSFSPFNYLCPSCRREIRKGDMLCAGCGRPLYVACPACGARTFVQERCENCSAGLMVYCQNTRCGHLQFFENDKCTDCGKKIKKPQGAPARRQGG